ncbi:hypothetical protein GQ55_6G038400 [Panicum hallii var. hallii]|uniref:MATH domain-containing protein n=1 Tax=Panicum hallii var. hallii TaxID=1504633 RepID=A0A2T7D3K8_9POAL|nr:hypothetical protein GQ55_6G038400 [Panicum hallii var. hallii]
MSAAQPLLSAAVRQLSRSAYGVVAAPARGFQVFRIDGYSWTKTLPAGERISSGQFVVGGRGWHIATTPTARTAPGTPTPTPSPSSSGSPPPTRRSACGRSTSSACSTPPATPRTSSPLRRASSPPPAAATTVITAKATATTRRRTASASASPTSSPRSWTGAARPCSGTTASPSAATSASRSSASWPSRQRRVTTPGDRTTAAAARAAGDMEYIRTSLAKNRRAWSIRPPENL